MNKYDILLAYTPSEQQFLPVPPLGISVLSQFLKNNGIENDILDLELELWLSLGNKSSEYASTSIEDLDADILPIDGIIEMLLKYDVVSLSIMGKRQIPYAIAISKKIRKMSNKLKYIIWGGAFFNEANAKKILFEYEDLVDYIIIGEGWGPLCDLLSNLGLNKVIEKIPGIAFKTENKVQYTENISWNDDLPLPNYKDVNIDGYLLQQKSLYNIDDKSIVYHVLVGDRKCPYKCSFCRISDTTKKIKAPESIANEMISLNELTGASCFSLVCNEMNPTEDYFNRFINQLLLYKKRLTWFCYLRPNKLNFETLKRASDAGCILVRYGVETGSQRILDHMNKELYVDEMNQIMYNTKKAGIWNHINIVTGYLHEETCDIELTEEFLEKNATYIDSVRVNPFYVPINSPIHLDPHKYGIKIRNNTGSHIQFDEPNCSWENKQKLVEHSTERILKKCIELKINFAGILPFLVAKAMDYFNDVTSAKKWIESQHDYLCLPISPDTAKWRLAHPDRTDVVINKWSEIAGKRGTNYQIMVERNNNENS